MIENIESITHSNGVKEIYRVIPAWAEGLLIITHTVFNATGKVERDDSIAVDIRQAHNFIRLLQSGIDQMYRIDSEYDAYQALQEVIGELIGADTRKDEF